MSASGRSRVWRRVAEALEAVLLEAAQRDRRSRAGRRSGSARPERVTRASSETASSGRRTWWRTRTQPAMSNAAVLERKRHRVALDEADVLGRDARAPPRGSRRACPRRRPRRRAARARTRAHRCRSPSRARRSEPENGPSSRRTRSDEVGRSLLLEREPRARRSRRSLRSEAACESERLLARRDRPRCPLLVDGREDTPDLGAGREVRARLRARAARRARRAARPRPARRAPARRRTPAHAAPRAPSRAGSGGSPRGDGSGRLARSSVRA